jgi:hypothetical protein
MENLKNKIIELFSEYQEIETIVKEKNKVVSEKGTTVQDLIKNKSVEELEDLLVHLYVDTILYNKDLQIVFFRLITNIETYIEFSKESLPKEILDFYNEMKTWSPKRVFMVEKGELVEVETGVLKNARKEFLESPFFKGITEQVTK